MIQRVQALPHQKVVLMVKQLHWGGRFTWLFRREHILWWSGLPISSKSKPIQLFYNPDRTLSKTPLGLV
jgi:hypothetical protein